MKVKLDSEHFKKQALVDSCIREGMNESRNGQLLSELSSDELKEELMFFKAINS